VACTLQRSEAQVRLEQLTLTQTELKKEGRVITYCTVCTAPVEGMLTVYAYSPVLNDDVND
jgi:hypothetical protein